MVAEAAAEEEEQMGVKLLLLRHKCSSCKNVKSFSAFCRLESHRILVESNMTRVKITSMHCGASDISMLVGTPTGQCLAVGNTATDKL